MKYLIFILFLFVGIKSYAQQLNPNQGYYELAIDYTLFNGNHRCRCESQIKITVHFEDNSTDVIKYQELSLDENEWISEKLWYVFPTTKKIKKIDVYTRRDYKNSFGNCINAGGGTWVINNITYPDFAINGTDANIAGYGSDP